MVTIIEMERGRRGCDSWLARMSSVCPSEGAAVTVSLCHINAKYHLQHSSVYFRAAYTYRIITRQQHFTQV